MTGMDVPDVANVSVLLPGAAVTVVVDMVAAAASAVAATTRGCEGRRRNEATRGERTRAFVVSKLRSMLFVKQVKVTSVHIYKSLIPRGWLFFCCLRGMEDGEYAVVLGATIKGRQSSKQQQWASGVIKCKKPCVCVCITH